MYCVTKTAFAHTLYSNGSSVHSISSSSSTDAMISLRCLIVAKVAAWQLSTGIWLALSISRNSLVHKSGSCVGHLLFFGGSLALLCPWNFGNFSEQTYDLGLRSDPEISYDPELSSVTAYSSDQVLLYPAGAQYVVQNFSAPEGLQLVKFSAKPFELLLVKWLGI